MQHLWITAIAVFAALALVPIVHAFYVWGVGIHRARQKRDLHWSVKAAVYPTFVVLVPVYILLNLTLGTLIFVELPRTLRFTRRCQRHMRKDTWRGRQARYWCREWLDPFQDGGHC